jgi:hypothetical protein
LITASHDNLPTRSPDTLWTPPLPADYISVLLQPLGTPPEARLPPPAFRQTDLPPLPRKYQPPLASKAFASGEVAALYVWSHPHDPLVRRVSEPPWINSITAEPSIEQPLFVDQTLPCSLLLGRSTLEALGVPGTGDPRVRLGGAILVLRDPDPAERQKKNNKPWSHCVRIRNPTAGAVASNVVLVFTDVVGDYRVSGLGATTLDSGNYLGTKLAAVPTVSNAGDRVTAAVLGQLGRLALTATFPLEQVPYPGPQHWSNRNTIAQLISEWPPAAHGAPETASSAEPDHLDGSTPEGSTPEHFTCLEDLLEAGHPSPPSDSSSLHNVLQTTRACTGRPAVGWRRPPTGGPHTPLTIRIHPHQFDANDPPRIGPAGGPQ